MNVPATFSITKRLSEPHLQKNYSYFAWFIYWLSEDLLKKSVLISPNLEKGHEFKASLDTEKKKVSHILVVNVLGTFIQYNKQQQK